MLTHLAILLPALAYVVAAPLEERASDLTNSAVTLAAPAPRLWRDASDSAQPCGGITFNGTRTNWPLCRWLSPRDLIHLLIPVLPAGGNLSYVVRADANRLAFSYSTNASKS